MSICDDCRWARRKLEHPNLLECKPEGVPAKVLLQAFYAFADSSGEVSEPFVVRAHPGASSDTAWPLQYDAKIIAYCEGKQEKSI